MLVNGARIYHEEHGDGAPILCVHGTSSSALAWSGAVPQLARLGRVIVYDRRGCTRSERPELYEVTSTEQHTDDARALLGALGAEPAVVIGRSYGGNVALDLALRHPASVRALVLLEACPAGLSAEADAWTGTVADMIERVAAERGVAAVAEAFAREVIGMWEELPADWRDMFVDNGPAILAELRGGDLRVDEGLLGRIAVPVLVVSGADSAAEFRAVSDALAEAIPNARSSRVAGGHIVDPASPVVLEFLADVTR